ncbi:hypothetical protein CUMW_277180 [Citrus unshiu]|uniref:Uncharacterized protein n=1 Tax=Citrus unshiu TaxID=55188 RepID=A0A2H5N3J0_CITUN|nr:hypothetical protein CUMW_277180 [Citrus unshiu]
MVLDGGQILLLRAGISPIPGGKAYFASVQSFALAKPRKEIVSARLLEARFEYSSGKVSGIGVARVGAGHRISLWGLVKLSIPPSGAYYQVCKQPLSFSPTSLLKSLSSRWESPPTLDIVKGYPSRREEVNSHTTILKSVIELKWERVSIENTPAHLPAPLILILDQSYAFRGLLASGLVFVVLEEILFPLIAGIQPLARSFQPVAHSFLVPAGRRGRFETGTSKGIASMNRNPNLNASLSASQNSSEVDNDCSVLFVGCVIQDLKSGKQIGKGRKEGETLLRR